MVILLIFSPMLQSAAGASSVCGAVIGPRQYTDAKRRLRVWYKSDDAFKCLWQCGRYLRGAVLADWGVHTPWAVFVTTVSFIADHTDGSSSSGHTHGLHRRRTARISHSHQLTIHAPLHRFSLKRFSLNPDDLKTWTLVLEIFWWWLRRSLISGRIYPKKMPHCCGNCVAKLDSI